MYWEKMPVNSFHCDEMVKNTIAVECVKGKKIWKDQRIKLVSFTIVVRLTGNIWSLWNLLIAPFRYHIIYIYIFFISFAKSTKLLMIHCLYEKKSKEFGPFEEKKRKYTYPIECEYNAQLNNLFSFCLLLWCNFLTVFGICYAWMRFHFHNPMTFV